MAPTVTLGGRTFEVRAVTVGEMLDLVDRCEAEKMSERRMTQEILALGLVGGDVNWIRSLPWGHRDEITEAGRVVREFSDIKLRPPGEPGEASGPATT